jgi:hypothetical protein
MNVTTLTYMLQRRFAAFGFPFFFLSFLSCGIQNPPPGNTTTTTATSATTTTGGISLLQQQIPIHEFDGENRAELQQTGENCEFSPSFW